VDAQCDKLATVVGRQFITLGVHLCVQHDGRDAARGAGLSASADICDVVVSGLLSAAAVLVRDAVQLDQQRFPLGRYLLVQ